MNVQPWNNSAQVFFEMFIRTLVQIEGLLSHYGADINAIP